MSEAVLDTPLDNLGLIEASAGTGKTYTLAGLFARAVIVERRAVPDILAVTFTIRATQELHERVRDRLLRAADLAARWGDGDPAQQQDDAGTALLRRLLSDALADGRETLPALRRRLDRAAREIDQAAIATIHGFCQRVLSEHALDTGQVLRPAEVVTSAREMHEAVALELWREWNSSGAADRADASAWLRARYGGPSGLADAMPVLLAPEPLLPLPPTHAGIDPRPALDAAWQAFRQSFAQHGEAAHDRIVAALQGKVLSGVKYKPEHVASLWAWLRTVVANDTPPTQWHDRLDRFTRAALADGCNKGQQPPDVPLCDAIAALIAARDAMSPWLEGQGLRCLHELRAQVRERARARKQAFQQRDFDDLIDVMLAAVTDPGHGPGLCAAVRRQFPLALIDEFQDTDARQWAIFDRLFGDHARQAGRGEDGNGLLLVGDPKQAIYRFRGGDVHTYQHAGAIAARVPPLAENFRSRPRVIETVNALFTHAYEAASGANAPQPLGEGIDFAATAPGGRIADDALLIDGAPAPALVFNELPPSDSGKDWNKDEAIEQLARGCAQAIRDLLAQAQDDRVLRRDGAVMRRVEARDCAVLVRAHAEAVAVRQALAQLGVPAVAAGRQSLFETPQAHELLTLLLALASPFDERRLRATLATRLFGFDAAQLHALADDGDALQAMQLDFAAWHLRWEQHGPQAMLSDVLARQATRLLALVDGERQLTCWLQLGELLQEARATATQPRGLGPQGQIDWLRAAIANADKDDFEQTPRLESDAGRVQILTLHASKGLEFALVFLPFVALGRKPKAPDVALYQWRGQRVRQVPTDHRYADEPAWGQADLPGSAVALHVAEEQDEDMRLLYVGLTRAREALWVWGGAVSHHHASALDRLMGGMRPSADLQQALGDRLRVEQPRLPPAADAARLPPQPQAATPPARMAARKLRRDWWIHSFSQLHRQKPHGVNALHEETPATDERPLAATPPAVFEAVDPRFRGERFGNAVHHALEHAEFARWAGHDDDLPPLSQHDVLVQALESQDYAADSVEDGVRELTRLVAATLNAPLPEGGRLCDLPASARVAEIEFHFTLAADGAALLQLLHRHGIALDRRDFGVWPRLSGLMNGKIDLTYLSGGRVHVLDYKSNLLPDYDAGTLATAMRASEYDLQALLYVVALHRWLGVRRGADYDYARDFGGVRYLFCRGLQRDTARGIIAPAFDAALVTGVDALLAQGAAP
ncbi:UvrD-helicase domain-containing protein [Agrilutibacter solisilvae]|uniref:RecBCD enzyme subunit RecB n=1 Tax=Agrilutibacter solisilvae TaxID=2763317 RepID=A0A975ASM9_9GAMM|nr:exodeoxyribonuclease V subunit beta [Lysobacter solisilvae]QSX79129.1 UvrD-helicase domain-containing protein [Lysobacter solisilvae]